MFYANFYLCMFYCQLLIIMPLVTVFREERRFMIIYALLLPVVILFKSVWVMQFKAKKKEEHFVIKLVSF